MKPPSKLNIIKPSTTMDRPSVSLFKPFSLFFVFPSHWPNVTHLRSRPFGFYLFLFFWAELLPIHKTVYLSWRRPNLLVLDFTGATSARKNVWLRFWKKTRMVVSEFKHLTHDTTNINIVTTICTSSIWSRAWRITLKTAYRLTSRYTRNLHNRNFTT